MELIDSMKKWPAAYSILALVMDDVSLDKQKAVEKWGGVVVSLAESYNNAPMEAAHVKSILSNLGIEWGVWQEVANTHTSQPETGTGKSSSAVPPPPSTPSTTPSSSPPPRSGGSRPNRKPGVKKRFTGTIQKVWDQDVTFRGKKSIRHMMLVIPTGQTYGVEGTIPRDFVGKVKAGDEVNLEAEVVEFSNRHGWYKWPKGMKVVSRA